MGASLGASAAFVGAGTSWASARLQAGAQVDVARLQQDAALGAETVARRRAAYEELILSVDAARRDMRSCGSTSPPRARTMTGSKPCEPVSTTG
ncbi:hypothetical protein ACIOWI_10905 [Streptomyces sp. NPDC087659]|uniref:hypothetical protein n=1 Tax=Streptomyces sp. NPDC087659 TaxID=3365801 RepID=UPI003814897C